MYDGDGKRVKSTIGGVATYFVGNYYEVTGSTVTKYYYAGSSRIAMRAGSAVYYLLADQLGSTSITTDAAGTKIAELRYKACPLRCASGVLREGEVRYTSGGTPTRYQYTGQYSHAAEFGLLFYNARWMDPALARFISADSIVPEGVQGWDRYAYGNNSPVNYNDPTGHRADCGTGLKGCERPASVVKPREQADGGGQRRPQSVQQTLPPHSGPAGWQIQVTTAVGFPLNAPPNYAGDPVDPLLFYGISLVGDDKGGVEIFGIRRDISFDPYYAAGPAERAYPAEYLGANVTVSVGVIDGESFRKFGTEAYKGRAIDYAGGIGPVGADAYVGFDERRSAIDPSSLRGFDIGYSWGGPFSGGRVAINAIPWFGGRIQLP